MFAAPDVALQYVFDKRRGAWVYIAKTSVFSFLIVVPIVVVVAWTGLGTPPEDTVEPILDRFLSLLVFSPLEENLVMVGLIELFLTLGMRGRTIIAIIATLSGIAHWMTADWRAVSGVIGFGTMAYSYLHWYECRFRKRFFITVMQHVLFNTPAFVILSISQEYG